VSIFCCPSSLRVYHKAEPGYYADGEYGIRTESVVVEREAQTPNNFGNKGFLGSECDLVLWYAFLCFPHVSDDVLTTFASRRLRGLWAETSSTCLSSAEERAWVDTYHQEVWEKVSPLLEGDERAKVWLHRDNAEAGIGLSHVGWFEFSI